MRIAVIPARGGSKRIPDKNIRPFCGRPMISYALASAASSGLFDKIHVSTDSERIRSVVADLGHPVDFMRPASLADDFTGLIPVLQFVLEEYQRRGERYEDVCILMPCSPLITEDDLVAGYKQYASFGGARPLHVVAPFPVPVEWAYRRLDDGTLVPVSPGEFAKRSQDLEAAYYESGPFSWFHRDHLLTDRPAADEGFTSIVLPKHKAIDMDDLEDFEFAEIIYTGMLTRAAKEGGA